MCPLVNTLNTREVGASWSICPCRAPSWEQNPVLSKQHPPSCPILPYLVLLSCLATLLGPRADCLTRVSRIFTTRNIIKHHDLRHCSAIQTHRDPACCKWRKAKLWTFWPRWGDLRLWYRMVSDSKDWPSVLSKKARAAAQFHIYADLKKLFREKSGWGCNILYCNAKETLSSKYNKNTV